MEIAHNGPLASEVGVDLPGTWAYELHGSLPAGFGYTNLDDGGFAFEAVARSDGVLLLGRRLWTHTIPDSDYYAPDSRHILVAGESGPFRPDQEPPARISLSVGLGRPGGSRCMSLADIPDWAEHDEDWAGEPILEVVLGPVARTRHLADWALDLVSG